MEFFCLACACNPNVWSLKYLESLKSYCFCHIIWKWTFGVAFTKVTSATNSYNKYPNMGLRYLISKRQCIIPRPCVICFVKKTIVTMCDMAFLGKTRMLDLLQVCCNIILTPQMGIDIWILQVYYWIVKPTNN